MYRGEGTWEGTGGGWGGGVGYCRVFPPATSFLLLSISFEVAFFNLLHRSTPTLEGVPQVDQERMLQRGQKLHFLQDAGQGTSSNAGTPTHVLHGVQATRVPFLHDADLEIDWI